MSILLKAWFHILWGLGELSGKNYMAQLKPHESRGPYDVSDALAVKVSALDLQQNLDEIRDQGFTVLKDAAPIEFSDRMRETIQRLSQETEGRGKGYSAALLLGRDPIFDEAVLNPKIMAMVDFSVGEGALLSQLTSSIRPKGTPALPLHADQNWTPAPFPEHNQLITFCWAMDDFTEAGGATRVIPGTHVHRRHPSAEETEAAEGAVPIICPKGSIACWDGSIWHGNYGRSLEGERVVMHMTYSRIALRTVEDYSHLGDDYLEGKPAELRTLLGRDDFFGSTTVASGGANMKKFAVTSSRSKL